MVEAAVLLRLGYGQTKRRRRRRERKERFGEMVQMEGSFPPWWGEIPAPARASVPEARVASEGPTAPTPSIAKRKWVPSADHPWRQTVRRGAERRASGGMTVATRPWLALPSASP